MRTIWIAHRFRPLRAGVFITFGLSGIAPATHYCVVNGWEKAVDQVAIGWLILMGCLYITGALLYAVRIPERFFPGKLDIWVRSCIQDRDSWLSVERLSQKLLHVTRAIC